MKRALIVCAVLACAGFAVAQPRPKGPADIIGGAQRERASREMKQAADRGKANQGAPVEPTAPINPHAGMVQEDGSDAPVNPHAGMAQDDTGEPANPHTGAGAHAGMQAEPGEPPALSSAHEDSTLQAGTIRVRVVDQAGHAVPSADLVLGIMGSDSNRSSQNSRTGADGTAVFSGLKVGEGQAYRVNAPYQGAKYSSTPFRLPLQGGYQVQLRRLPVTQSDRMIVLYVGATSIELKDDRLKLVQQVRLYNLGPETYVFPAAGTLVPLPKGAMAVQTEDVMGDQHVVEAKGEGVRVSGSLPPGEATLLWGFDLPLSGTEANLSFDLPWVTFAYRVIADAPEGMSLSVADMPEPLLHNDAGRRFLVTELQRKVGDEPFRSLKITLRGIPGPGPERFIASILGFLMIAGGVVFAWRTKPANAARIERDVEAQKAEVLARARVLQTQRDADEIGPQYHAEELGLLVDALASLLLEDVRRKHKTTPGTRV